jgi:hypothetical protein
MGDFQLQKHSPEPCTFPPIFARRFIVASACFGVKKAG